MNSRGIPAIVLKNSWSCTLSRPYTEITIISPSGQAWNLAFVADVKIV